MKTPAQMSKTAIMVETALMVALAFVLAFIPVFSLPFGGSITAFSTVPLLVLSLRHSMRWSMAAAAISGVLQAWQGLDSILIAGSVLAMVGCALLDYLLAYACLGLAGPIARRFANPTLGLIAGVVATGLMRLLCSFLSGVLIWGSWAPETMSVWWYSLSYNAGWCLPDVAAALVAALALSRVKVLGLAAPLKSKAAA